MTTSEIVRIVIIVVLVVIIIARRMGSFDKFKERRQKQEEQAAAARLKEKKKERREQMRRRLEQKRRQTTEMLRQTMPGMEIESRSVAGQEIHYAVGGDPRAPTVVLLHGFATDKECWRLLAPKLLHAKLRVLAPDLPGFGQNEPDPEGDYEVTTQAKRIRALLNALGIEHAHLVGHSMGGSIAAAIAYGAAQSVQSLTLIEPFGVRVPYDSALDEMLAAGRNPLVIAAPAAYANLVGFLHAQPPSMPAALEQHRAELAAARRAFYLRVWQQVCTGERAHLLDLLLPEVKVRTLVIQGSESQVVHPATAQVVSEMMRDCHSRVFEGCGHMAMVERPDETVQAILELVRSTS